MRCSYSTNAQHLSSTHTHPRVWQEKRCKQNTQILCVTGNFMGFFFSYCTGLWLYQMLRIKLSHSLCCKCFGCKWLLSSRVWSKFDYKHKLPYLLLAITESYEDWLGYKSGTAFNFFCFAFFLKTFDSARHKWAVDFCLYSKAPVYLNRT
jgi:hypothetical protein